jgi:VanZ family protein
MRIICLLAMLALIVMVFVGGSQPGAGNLFPPPLDKAVHFLTFGSMLALASIAFPKTRLLHLLVMVVSIGIADEVHQIYLPGRVAGLDDLLSDFAGGLVTMLAIGWATNRNV